MPLLTIQEVTDRLRISRGTLYKLINAGELPKTKVRKRTFIDSTDVDAYLERQSERAPSSPLSLYCSTCRAQPGQSCDAPKVEHHAARIDRFNYLLLVAKGRRMR